jgi:hypothetical protein
MKNDLDGMSVLIVGYRRAENILKLLRICQISGIANIYLSIDGPKSNSASGQADYNKIKEYVALFEQDYSGNLKIHLRNRNVGCAASVMSSCDWFFEQTDYGVILEDDCIPTKDFFIFAKNMEQKIYRDSKIWLVCGTQFAPDFVINNSVIISQYALTWGWATNKAKWVEIKRSFTENNQFKVEGSSRLGTVDKAYWAAGARRAYAGFTDVWDTVLVYRMQVENKYAILPPENLITNVGNDFAATHTHIDSDFLNKVAGTFSESTDINYSATVDKWLKNNLYGISIRHVFSTKIRLFLDTVNPQKRNKVGLLQRWNNASIEII